jgi:hypothetical protein
MTSKNTTPPSINPAIQATTPGYRYHRVVPMIQLHEDQELYLPMVVMTGRENSLVEANAFQDTLALFKGKAPKTDEPSNWDEQLEAQRAYWTIFVCTRMPEDLTTKYFQSKQQVEDTYNWDEISVLLANYVEVRINQPTLKNVDPNNPNAFQEIIDTIKKLGPDSNFFLNGITSHSVNQLIRYLVAQVETLQTNSGLSGTP